VSISNQLFRPLVQLLEIVRRVIQPIVPVETQPAHIFHDRFDIFRVLLLRIRVVEPQVALSTVLRGNAEVEADTFGMTDVQIAIGFRGKSSLYSAVPFAGTQIVFHDLAYKVPMRIR